MRGWCLLLPCLLLYVIFLLRFTFASNSCILLSLACSVLPLSRVTFQAQHGPRLTLLSQQQLLSSFSTVVLWHAELCGYKSDHFKQNLMCKETHNSTETTVKNTVIISMSLCVIASPLIVSTVVISMWQSAAHNWLLITDFCIVMCCIKNAFIWQYGKKYICNTEVYLLHCPFLTELKNATQLYCSCGSIFIHLVFIFFQTLKYKSIFSLSS